MYPVSNLESSAKLLVIKSPFVNSSHRCGRFFGCQQALRLPPLACNRGHLAFLAPDRCTGLLSGRRLEVGRAKPTMEIDESAGVNTTGMPARHHEEVGLAVCIAMAPCHEGRQPPPAAGYS
jgi:hypothetical protein